MHLVQLDISASRPCERGDLSSISRRKIREELIEIRISPAIDRITPAAAMRKGGRWQGDFGHARGDALQVFEILDRDIADVRDRPNRLEHSRCIAAFHPTLKLGEAARTIFDAGQLGQKIDMKCATPIVPIGNRVEANRFLPGNDFPDASVFNDAQCGRRQGTGGACFTRGDERGRSKNAADMIGT